MKIDMAWIKEHGKEIAIALLLLALLIISLMMSNTEGTLRSGEANRQRQDDIATTEAGRKEVENRENNEYPALDRSAQEIQKRREAIKKEESATTPPTRKEIEDAITKTTQGDSNRLADLFRRDGYPCTVTERGEPAKGDLH